MNVTQLPGVDFLLRSTTAGRALIEKMEAEHTAAVMTEREKLAKERTALIAAAEKQHPALRRAAEALIPKIRAAEKALVDAQNEYLRAEGATNGASYKLRADLRPIEQRLGETASPLIGAAKARLWELLEESRSAVGAAFYGDGQFRRIVGNLESVKRLQDAIRKAVEDVEALQFEALDQAAVQERIGKLFHGLPEIDDPERLLFDALRQERAEYEAGPGRRYALEDLPLPNYERAAQAIRARQGIEDTQVPA